MRKNSYIAHLFAFTFGMSACGQSEETPAALTGMPIRWEVTSVEGMSGSRALIGSGENEISLQAACTNGEAIAVWGEYTQDDVNYVEAFDGTPLTFGNNAWSYTGGYRYWMDRSVYRFRACYPKNALGNLAVATDASKLTVAYNTETLQEDLLVAYQEVDSERWDHSQAVPLQMYHALAALRFQFQVVGDETMTLHSFSLENATQGLGTQGTLTSQDEEVKRTDWTTTAHAPGSYYVWQHPDGGIAFTNTTMATAYSSATDTSIGNAYTGNNGYVLIIPQAYNGGTKLSFSVDGYSYQVELPAKEFLPGYRYTYLLQVTANNAVSLTCTVQPWTLQEEDMNFKDYVTMDTNGQLQWLSGSVEEKANDVNEVYLDGETIQCKFHIATPEGAIWYATLIPVDGSDMNAFALVDGTGNETGLSLSGEVGQTATLTIKRKTIKEFTRMRLQITVRDLNGRTFVVHKDVLGSENYIWCQP